MDLTPISKSGQTSFGGGIRLMLTCRACGVEPFAWLRHVFTEMPQRPDGADINDLLPFNFAKTAPD